MIDPLSILQHALGLDRYGQGSQFRNHFVTGASSVDHPVCLALVEQGLMQIRSMSRAVTGGDDCFVVTPKGIDYVATNSPQRPPEPKLTRSQMNYRAYLAADCDFTFGEWMRFPKRALRV